MDESVMDGARRLGFRQQNVGNRRRKQQTAVNKRIKRMQVRYDKRKAGRRLTGAEIRDIKQQIAAAKVN